ncbi:unnamed protein product, partial [Discosporangium mesarthrocarpum]
LYAEGGAIRVVEGALNVTNCVFENNYAGLGGGAIFANLSTVVVESSLFRNCQAGKRPLLGD